MMSGKVLSFKVTIFITLSCLTYIAIAQAVPYDIVYVRAAREGDDKLVRLPEVFYPIKIPVGTDLMLLHPDGSEEVLVPGGDGAIVDPTVSFDGLWVYYTKFHDQQSAALDKQRAGDPSRAGADIYKVNLQTRQIVRLTHQEWTPNTGVVAWSDNHLEKATDRPFYLGYGIFNLGPCPLPGGKVMFSSSRNAFLPNKGFTSPNLQLYVMDNDGRNVELVGHMNLGSALHPTVLKDGRVMFSSYEAQGLRDRRMWSLWSIWPDGRGWEPLMSAFSGQHAFHFQTQLSNGDIVIEEYYNLNNNGFGSFIAFPANRTTPFGSFDSKDPSNPDIQQGIWWFDDKHSSHKKPKYRKYPFSPPGLYAMTAFTHGTDSAASRNQDGEWAGKVTHPSGAPNNDLLLVWTPGPANNLNRPITMPYYDGGLYVLKNGTPLTDEADLVCIKNDPNYNELQPRAVVTYKEIYEVDAPATISWYQNDGSDHASLEPGTPFGLVGTSTFYRRDTSPTGKGSFAGMDPFNSSQNGTSTNWVAKGSSAGVYSNSDIYAVRVLSMEPSSHVGRGPGIGNGSVRGFYNHASERLRILGEIPLRKKDANGNVVMDPDGNPDTSFLSKIPADTPFTFQTLDEDGLVLNMSQTWHQVRPGEARHDCGGCHGHSQEPLAFQLTAAAKEDYDIVELALSTPLITKDSSGKPAIRTEPTGAVDVEFHRDIKPILQRSCVGCHSQNNSEPAAQLVLDDDSIIGGYDATYRRLARDEKADYGIKPIISNGTWRQTNASRYVRKFQSRRSLLMWKIFGRRLDGWTNEDHPTESVPGDPSTLPEEANADNADIDYTGTIMPPPDSDPALYPRLSEDEKIMFARWIDLGCPVNSQTEGVQQDLGWFADELRPTLDVSLPKAGRHAEPFEMIRLGMFDYYSGLEMSSLSVTADFEIDGNAAGTELAGSFALTGDHIWTYALAQPITSLDQATITVEIKDHTGNVTAVARTFSVGPVHLDPNLTVIGDGNDGKLKLSLTGEPQNPYALEYSDDFKSWNPLMRLMDFDGYQEISEQIVPEIPKRFYRAVREER